MTGQISGFRASFMKLSYVYVLLCRNVRRNNKSLSEVDPCFYNTWLSLSQTETTVTTIITFRQSRKRREMYCGHARLFACLCVCPRPHAHIIARSRMQLGGVVGDAT